MKKIQYGRVLPGILIVLLTYLIWQSSWNFVYLGGLLFLLCILLYFYYYRGKKLDLNNQPIRDLRGTTWGIVSLLVLGWFSVLTLNNYFEADSSVYKNSNHYALRMDGIRLKQADKFIVAGAENNAFFDQKQFMGDIVIENVNDSSIQLGLQRFTHSFYQEFYNEDGRLDKLSLRNAESMFTFTNQDTLQFKMQNGSIYQFYVDELSEEDSVFYHLITPQGENLVSVEHRFLTRGLSLNTLLGGISCEDTDFSDIHLVRPVIYTQVKKKERVQRYQDIGFAVELRKEAFGQSGNRVEAIGILNKRPFESIQQMAQKHITVSLPLGACFSIGYDENRTRSAYFNVPESNKEILELKYKMPLYHYFASLNSRDDNMVYVTSTLAGNIDLTSIPENIMLFQQFEHPENIFQLRPFYLSYVAGKTTEELKINYFDGINSRTYKAGEAFVNVQTNGTNDAEWIVEVENFKQTAPFSPFLLKLTVALLTLGLAFLLFWGSNSLEPSRNVYRLTFSVVEAVAYMVLLYLVTFRVFLLWRVAVFPPVEQVSYYEFNTLFRSDYNYKILVRCLIVFLGSVFLLKGFVYFQWGYKWWNRLNQKKWIRGLAIWLSNNKTDVINKKPLIIGWSISVMLMLICILIKKPFISISMPVALYFLNVLLINYYTAGDEIIPHNSYPSLSWKQRPVITIILSILNGFIVTVLLLYTDSGFSILFLTFLLFWFIFRLHDYCKFYLSVYRERKIIHMPSLIFTILLILLALLICNYKKVIGYIYTDSYVPYLIVALVGFVISYMVIFAINCYKNKTALLTSIIISAILFGSCWAFNWYLSNGGQHTAQRIVVHFKDPIDALQDVKYKETVTRYFQTSLNHMVIGEYNKCGTDISLIGEGGHGYFKMYPHSKVGALWNAQLTDISLVRYVIAEHSQLLSLVLIGCYLLLLLVGLRMPTRHWGARSILVQIPLLLFIQSLLIWMANTQRFIFLGQDFPMVSINSRLTLAYYFMLTFIWLAVAIYEKTTLLGLFDNRYRVQNERSKRDMFQMSALLALCLISCVFFISQRRIEEFKITDLFIKMQQEDLKRLNVDFKNFQDSLDKKIDLRRDMSAVITAFDRKYDGESYFIKDFGKQLWRNYVQFGCKDNNPQDVMHVHYAREDDRKYLKVDVLSGFYNKKLPKRNKSVWRGNIVSVPGKNMSEKYKLTTNSLIAYRLPSDWLYEGKDKVMVCSKRAFIIGNDTPPIDMSKGINSAAILQEGDQVLVNGQVQDLSTIQEQKSYFARNVMVNGQRTFVYPLREHFYWIRNFAREVKKQRSDEFAEKNLFYKDIKITLSAELFEKVYPYLEKTGLSGCGVIAADGDGAITLMADYKKGYELDPNNEPRIEQLRDSIYMSGDRGSEIERNYFANINLTYLKDGPGSTQKPIVWTAVASVVDLPWKNISIADYKGSIASANGNFIIRSFNNSPFLKKHPFRTLTSDENFGKGVNLSQYMMKSSNVYNATMVYIGSFTFHELQDKNFLEIAHTHDGVSLFNRVPSSIIGEEYQKAFPILKNGNNIWMSLNRPIQKEYIEQSVLQLQLRDFFGVDANIYGEGAGYGGSVSLAPELIERNVLSNGYAYAEYSYLNASERGKMLMENAVRSTAIGAQRVWEVTPLKMTEMFGRLTSLNQNYGLTLSVEKTKKRCAQTYKSFSEGYREARPLQLDGMNRVISSEGTANRIASILRVEQKSGKAIRFGKYYLYAKTGTINSDSRNHADRHRLGVIITKQDLSKTPIDKLDEVKFYVVYFTFNRTGQFETYANILKEIVESDTFKRYMN